MDVNDSLEKKLEDAQIRIEELEDALIEQKLFLYDIASKFIPRKILRLLDKSSLEDLKLGESTNKEMTVLFSDIRGFTTISESMSSEKVFKFLNFYFKNMVPYIDKNHGFVDKFIGDAIMALFPESAEDALKAAITMKKVIKKINKHNSYFEKNPINAGTGLHHGLLTLGLIGWTTRIESTAIGDTVNLASRIENATKMYNVNIIISDTVKKELPQINNYHFREIDTVRVKGKDNFIVLYEVYDADEEEIFSAKKESQGHFQKAIDLFKAGSFAQSLELFNDIQSLSPKDPIVPIYQKRLHTLVRIPPGPGWTGVSGII